MNLKKSSNDIYSAKFEVNNKKKFLMKSSFYIIQYNSAIVALQILRISRATAGLTNMVTSVNLLLVWIKKEVMNLLSSNFYNCFTYVYA